NLIISLYLGDFWGFITLTAGPAFFKKMGDMGKFLINIRASIDGSIDGNLLSELILCSDSVDLWESGV
ncbi:MAG: hypothetical protein ACYTFE_04790, partial [Planctomycetota bacterium]